MGFISRFLHNEALAEILFEGHNPYALQKLASADLDALRQKVPSEDGLQAYVIGRIVLGGRGVWALTGQAVLLCDPALRGVQRIDLAEVESFEAVRGRFGHTVRLRAQGRLWSLFGADRDLAGLMHQAFTAAGVTSRFDDRPARSHVWRASAPEGWARDCVVDARRRLALA